MTVAVVVALTALAIDWVPGSGIQTGGFASVFVNENNLDYARNQPVCASRWLLAAPGGINIFNQYGEGGYLAYAVSGHGDKVYVFGDAALMGDPLLIQYGQVEGVNPNWEQVILNSGADIFLFDAGAPIANTIDKSKRWVRVYSDPHNVAYAPAARLAQLHLPNPNDVAGTKTGVCALLNKYGETGAR